jgi:hypothetical protein
MGMGSPSTGQGLAPPDWMRGPFAMPSWGQQAPNVGAAMLQQHGGGGYPGGGQQLPQGPPLPQGQQLPQGPPLQGLEAMLSQLKIGNPRNRAAAWRAFFDDWQRPQMERQAMNQAAYFTDSMSR